MRRVPHALRLLRRDDAQLFLVSATVLFVELLLIRWVPANVIYVGFFNNFLLLASFLGIGIGILLGRRGRRPPVPPSVALLAVIGLVLFAKIDVRGRDDVPLHVIAAGSPVVTDVLVLTGIVALTATVMALVAVPLGPLLRSMPPLRAYAIDVAGSLAGIAGFAALALLATPPLAWFSVVALLLGVRAVATPGGPARDVRRALMTIVSAAAIVGVLALADPARAPKDVWSPYYRITRTSIVADTPALMVNGIPHQAMWRAADPRKEVLYDQIYRWFPGRIFRHALVVGAGSGTDTALALRQGAGRIDAVEIDPLILELGRRDHPDRPYANVRVRTHVNDGRAFLRTSDERYDLIVFAQTDSLALVTATSNLRLESFLFTREAFASVREHLTSDGIFLLYNQYQQTFIADRIARNLELTFGSPPLVSSYALGPKVNFAVFAAGPGIAALRGGPPPGGDGGYRRAPASTLTATDDWPFQYVLEPGIPSRYVLALGAILLFALVAVLATSGVTRTAVGLSPHFFLLGVAFLLLETRSLVTFSLLFGTTWIVNALVFFAILASVLAAIFVSARARGIPARALYAALLGALALAYLLPPSSLLIEPAWLRYVLASAIAFAPIFLANLVFAHSFRDTEAADLAFASNLLGAMLGGVLEWLALVTGYQALLVVVAALYGGAYVAATRVRWLGDRHLVLAPRVAQA